MLTKENMDFFEARTLRHKQGLLKFANANEHLTKPFSLDEKLRFINNIKNHDRSKHSIEEYEAYVLYTWARHKGLKFNQKEKLMFEKAKCHHYEVNKHHPEYWKTRGAEMSRIYILEMLCDWASVSYEFNQDLFKWIEQNVERFNFNLNESNTLFNFIRDFKY